MSKLILGAVLYEGFELLDMFGPLEMFTALPPDKFEVVMIAEKKGGGVRWFNDRSTNAHGKRRLRF